MSAAVGFFSLVLAVLIAPALAGLEQAFQFIQEFTGFISPGALAIFVMGFLETGRDERSPGCGCRNLCLLAGTYAVFPGDLLY